MRSPTYNTHSRNRFQMEGESIIANRGRNNRIGVPNHILELAQVIALEQHSYRIFHVQLYLDPSYLRGLNTLPLAHSLWET